MNEHLKSLADGAAAGIALTTFFTTWLPVTAALLSIIWTGIRIYEWIQSKRKT